MNRRRNKAEVSLEIKSLRARYVEVRCSAGVARSLDLEAELRTSMGIPRQLELHVQSQTPAPAAALPAPKRRRKP